MTTSPLLRCIAWTGGTSAAMLTAAWGTMLVLGSMIAPIFMPTGLPPSRNDVLLLCVIGVAGFLLTLICVGKIAVGAAGYWRSWACPEHPRLAWPAVTLAAVLAVTAADLL